MRCWRGAPKGRTVGETTGMEMFVRVVERGSFSAAAQDLNLTPSAISKQVSRLEGELGVRLINRSTHDLNLTEAGKIYYDRCLKILREIEQAREAVHEANATLSGTLKIHVTPGTGQLIVLPILNEFLRVHPALSVDLTVEPAYVDVLQNGLDISIRSGTGDDSNLRYTSVECRALTPVKYLICASDEYFKRCGKPKEPRDLARHDCVIYTAQPSAEQWWFMDGKKRYSVNVKGRYRADDWSAIHNAVRDGLGIGRLLAPSSNLLGGSLKVIFPAETVCDRQIWAFYPRARTQPRKLTLLLDYLQAALERSQRS